MSRERELEERVKFLEKTLKSQLGYTLPHVWMDVAELMPAFFPKATIKGRGLDDWADVFGLEISERHHAAADALVTAARLNCDHSERANRRGCSRKCGLRLWRPSLGRP